MPIRFRCAYCSQLMSIATRKAGAVIRCTKCAGEIIVPMPDGQALPEPLDVPLPGSAFESANFDVDLNSSNDSTNPAESAPLPTPSLSRPTQPAGLFLSVPLLLVSIGVVIVLLIAMFTAGFTIGRMTAGPVQDM